nr:winged helix-turn-helix transcriptional regulator [Actinoplanes sp. N902-109]
MASTSPGDGAASTYESAAVCVPDEAPAPRPARHNRPPSARTRPHRTARRLSHEPVRHGDPAALIGGVSRKMLTQTLRRLDAHGLARRQTYAGARRG